MDDAMPSRDDIASTFEAVTTGSPAVGLRFRGTHRHDSAVVERTYSVEEGTLAVETAYHDDDETIEVINECWLLDDSGEHLAHTGQELDAFCRDHHFDEPERDVAFCLEGATAPADNAGSLSMDDVISTFEPASHVQIDEGSVLRYAGVHEAGDARVEREYFVDETGETLTVKTAYLWDGESLGSLEEQQALIDDGTFVAKTGEPVEAFCRRTHLVEPARDVTFCAELAGESVTDGEFPAD